MLREGGKGQGECFTLTPEVSKRQRQESAYGAIELVGGRLKLGEQQVGGLGSVTKVA